MTIKTSPRAPEFDEDESDALPLVFVLGAAVMLVVIIVLSGFGWIS